MTTTTLEERKFESEKAARTRELEIREREVAAKESEIEVRERELRRSRWFNPTFLALCAAAIGLFGSFLVARVNNENTQEVERMQSESNITLEAIKTGTGNTDAACKNLVFLVSLGLIRDVPGKIQAVCKDVPLGPPSLPAEPQRAPSGFTPIQGTVTSIEGEVVDDNNHPLAGVRVELAGSSAVSNATGRFKIEVAKGLEIGQRVQFTATKEGYSPAYPTLAVPSSFEYIHFVMPKAAPQQ